MSWSGTKVRRLEKLYDLGKLDFEFSNNWGKSLKVNDVVYSDSRLPHDTGALIFYYLITERDTLHNFENLRSSVSFLEYSLAQKNLDSNKYLILLCGDQELLKRLSYLKAESTFKYTKMAVINIAIFKKLSLPVPASSMIITDKDHIIWCSIGHPDDLTISQLLRKLVS